MQQNQKDTKIFHLNEEKKALTDKASKLEMTIEKYINDLKIQEKKTEAVAHQLKSANHCIEMQKKIVSSLEDVRQKLVQKISELTQKIEQLQSQITHHEKSEEGLKKQITELTDQLKKQSELCNVVTNDKNSYMQNYKEIKEDLEKNMKKVDLFNVQIEELKKSINAKEEKIEDLSKTIEKLENEKRHLLEKMGNQTSEINELKLKVKHQEEEIKKQLLIISEKEKEHNTLQAKLVTMRREHDVLETQVQKQNTELNFLNEKLKISEARIEKDSYQCQQYENNLKLMQTVMSDLCREKSVLSKKLAQLEKLKAILVNAQEQLISERKKTKALEEAMQNPLNIHRWRLLQGTDPDRYDLIMKTRLLQKRLMNKTIETEKIRNELNEANKTTEVLKEIAAKQTSPERSGLLAEAKRKLREKTDKINILTAQVNMYESLLSDHQSEIDRLKEELRKTKRNQLLMRAKAKEI